VGPIALTSSTAASARGGRADGSRSECQRLSRTGSPYRSAPPCVIGRLARISSRRPASHRADDAGSVGDPSTSSKGTPLSELAVIDARFLTAWFPAAPAYDRTWGRWYRRRHHRTR
jgi:hypothetical protein